MPHRAPTLLVARVAALLVALLLPIGASAQETPWGWAEGRPIQDVVWQGLETIHPADAQGMIETRAGETFAADRLSLDVARLYRSARFGSPRQGVPPISVTVRPTEGEGVRVEFTVHERQRIEAYTVRGLGDRLEDEVVRSAITLRVGDPYDPHRAHRDAEALRRALVKERYLNAEVRPEPVSLPGGGLKLVYQVQPGPRVHVEEIIYEGAKALDPSIIAEAEGPDALETKERSWWGLSEDGTYDPDAFTRDLDRIARYYRSEGYLDARVYKREERFSLDGEELTLVVGIEEGLRYTVRRVAVEGAKALDGDRIREALPLRAGRPFLGADLQRSIEQVRHIYGQRAYVHARVDIDVRYDRERQMLDVVLHVDEGPKVRIDKIRIVGNTKTKEVVVRRELSFYPGEYFDADQIQASIARLGRLRYFKDVRIDFEPGSEPGRENVVVTVVEDRTGAFVFGGGVSTSTGFFGNISIEQRNFDLFAIPTSWTDISRRPFLSGGGQRLALSIQPGRERSQYSIEFNEPYLLGLPVPLTLIGSIRDRQRANWLESRLSGQLGLGYRITQDLIFRATYRLERIRIADLDVDAVPDAVEVAGNNIVSALRLSLSYNQNLVDRYSVVYGGYALSGYYELAGKWMGGDHDFNRAGANANIQQTVLEWPREHRWVIALRGEVGWEEELGDSRVPIFERFFAGGPNSVRGFRFRSVGPKWINGDPVGGDFLLRGTAEFSYPLFQQTLRGVLFVDAGTVTDRIRDLNLDEIRVAAGFGFRINLPIFPAPVALDFAWPLQDKPDDDRQVFSFSVGFGF